MHGSEQNAVFRLTRVGALRMTSGREEGDYAELYI
jgi:hypothetical protein